MENNYHNDIVYYDNKFQKSEFADVILLQYPSNGDNRQGTIRIKRAINLRKDEIEYLGIEYSDENIKHFVEKNPSVLAKIDGIRTK